MSNKFDFLVIETGMTMGLKVLETTITLMFHR